MQKQAGVLLGPMLPVDKFDSYLCIYSVGCSLVVKHWIVIPDSQVQPRHSTHILKNIKCRCGGMADAPGLGPDAPKACEFKSHHLYHGSLVQLVRAPGS